MAVLTSVLVRDKVNEERSMSLFLFDDFTDTKLPPCKLLRDICDFTALDAILAVTGEVAPICSLQLRLTPPDDSCDFSFSRL
jgi:hypothetical protein